MFSLLSPVTRMVYTIPVDLQRKSSGSVTAAGIVAIAGSLLIAAGAALGIVGLYVTPTNNVNGTLPPMAKTLAGCMIAFVLVLAVFGIVTGIFLLRLRNWARISTLIWSGLTVVFCALVMAVIAISPFPTPPNAPQNFIGFVRAAVLIFYGLPFAIALWWLILFNKKSVVMQFAGSAGSFLDASGFPAEPVSTSRLSCPLPLMVLAGFLLFSSLSAFLIFLLPMPLLLFGYPVRGLPATILWIASSGSCAAAGIGLLRLRPWGFWLAVGLQLFWFCSGVVSMTNANYPQVMQEVLDRTRARMGDSPQYSVEQLKPYSYAGLATPVLIGGLLLAYRRKFLAACAAPRP